MAIVTAVLLLVGMTGFAYAGGLEIKSVKAMDNGNVRVEWKDPNGNGPYMITFQYGDGTGDTQMWRSLSDLKGTSGEMIDLAPGEPYTIYVIDKDYHYDSIEYKGKTQRFGGEGSGTRLTMTPRQKSRGRASTIKSYSASAITASLKSDDTFYGATVKATLPNGGVRGSIAGTFRMAAKAPDGQVIVFMIQDETIRNAEYVYYDTYNFNGLWQSLIKVYDEIPQGKYTMGFYINNDFIGYQDFTIGK